MGLGQAPNEPKFKKVISGRRKKSCFISKAFPIKVRHLGEGIKIAFYFI
jgi:hypothetical protein